MDIREEFAARLAAAVTSILSHRGRADHFQIEVRTAKPCVWSTQCAARSLQHAASARERDKILGGAVQRWCAFNSQRTPLFCSRAHRLSGAWARTRMFPCRRMRAGFCVSTPDNPAATAQRQRPYHSTMRQTCIPNIMLALFPPCVLPNRVPALPPFALLPPCGPNTQQVDFFKATLPPAMFFLWT